MKALVLTVYLVCTGFFSFSQKTVADSLAALLAAEKKDTVKATLLWKIANACNIYNPDTALVLAKEALFISEKNNFIDGKSMANGSLANTFMKIGNYPKALEHYFQKLKIEEKRDNPVSLASVTMNIGIVYAYEEEYTDALTYYFKADSIITTRNVEQWKYHIALNLGDVYNRLNKNDSAYIYFKKSFDEAVKLQDGDLIGTSMVGLGHSYFKEKRYELSKENYLGALPYLYKANDEELICEAASGLAKLYDTIHQPDSARYFARLQLSLAKKDGFLSWELDAAGFLTGHYRRLSKADSTLAYITLAQELKDSINSKDRIRQSQILSSNEHIRQIELAESMRKTQLERKQQLQLLFIGIFIPAFFLVTLLLSRIRIPVRLIKFMGIISLLIFFEYLTLLLHPYVAELTHHTPLYEMLIFVSIAAFLIPAHHRVEHWFIDKLTQRRNAYENGVLKLKTARLKAKKPSR